MCIVVWSIGNTVEITRPECPLVESIKISTCSFKDAPLWVITVKIMGVFFNSCNSDFHRNIYLQIFKQKTVKNKKIFVYFKYFTILHFFIK